METKRKQWNIQQLNIERIKDLACCQTKEERNMCNSICKREILTLAVAKIKLSGCDIAILTSLFNTNTLKAEGIIL
jgi:hypothetical protein